MAKRTIAQIESEKTQLQNRIIMLEEINTGLRMELAKAKDVVKMIEVMAKQLVGG